MSAPPAGTEWPQTRAELARRHGVHVSTITRALQQATAAHQADASAPAPPAPVNPGEPQPRYLPNEFDPWWATRPGRGRPRTTERRTV